MTMAADIYRSARLVYRSVQPEDETIFCQIQSDPIALRNSNPRLEKPPTRKDAQDLMRAVEEALLGVVICLPSPPGSSPPQRPIAIGDIHLSPLEPDLAHHRFTTIHINIMSEYQGQGYGSEAINWALDWAFSTAGIHRVGVQVLGFNTGAKRLYERLGFKQEGVTRDMFWQAGRWWDDIQFGMLDAEWKKLREGQESRKQVKW
ncbi:acyl-CoA N-acyltransferase [Coniella lustricola]|uniref:Acyl-CoA N-acyltransferase n=1 Tax=Coniella lustricola TaxID=2025994 RepID=A0A2T2ZZX0_9PEZI|nr:acyl-CoA N-acyltransferase [Coniella lustricola]